MLFNNFFRLRCVNFLCLLSFLVVSNIGFAAVSGYTPTAKPEEDSADYKAATLKRETCGTLSYPQMAIRFGLEGRVLVDLDIGAQGDVFKVRVVESSGAEILDLATIAYFSQCKFNPAIRSGNAVASTKKMKQLWTIEDELIPKDSKTPPVDFFGGSNLGDFSVQMQKACTNFMQEVVKQQDYPLVTSKISSKNVCLCVDEKLKADRVISLLLKSDEASLQDIFDQEKFTNYFIGKLLASFFSCTADSFYKAAETIDPLKTKANKIK